MKLVLGSVVVEPIYLDYAAATPLDPHVLAAMKPYLEENFYNPSATYLAGRHAKQVLESARAQVAQVLGSRPAEIIFTAGATEANNLAIQGIMNAYPGGEVIYSAVEHESVLAPAQLYKGNQIPVDKNGVIDLLKLQKIFTDKTVLVSAMYVNNELGTIQPLRQISTLLRQIRTNRLKIGNKLPIYLHTDAAQAGNYLDLHVSRLGVDLMSLNGGKLYGPRQSGVLFIKSGVKLRPLILGGGQEFGLRSGTENLAAVVGFALAITQAQEQHQKEADRLKKLRLFFANELQKALPHAVINGSDKQVAPHILSVTFPGADNERLMMELDEKGISTAVGSACSASNSEPSHVLGAIGLTADQARATLRFSMGRTSSQNDIKTTISSLAQALDD